MNEQDIKNDILLDDEEHIIDVAASFNCKHQDEEYNEAYKKWRADETNSFAYNFVNDTREHAYLDGSGFIEQSPDTIERTALLKNMKIISAVLIVSLLIETFGKYIYICISKLFGCGVNLDFFLGLSNASDGYIVLMEYVLEISSRITPVLLLIYFLKLPNVVVFPMKITNKDMHNLAIPAMMVMFTIINYGSAFLGKILSFSNIEMTHITFFMPKSFTLAILNFILNIIIVPVLTELCLRGAIMQSLRQFGDGFALITTSIISAFMVHDLTCALCAFVVSLVIGYFVLRTGSLLTGIIMRVFFWACAYLTFLVNFYCNKEIANLITSVIMFVSISLGFLIILATVRKKRGFVFLSIQKTYITTKEKLLDSITALPTTVWIIYIFILTLMSIKFRE